MASITFTGPNPVNPSEQSTVVVNMPDELLMMTVNAICNRYGYQTQISDGAGNLILNPEGPGTFTIRKTMDFYKENVLEYTQEVAARQAKEEVRQQLAAREGEIVIEESK